MTAGGFRYTGGNKIMTAQEMIDEIDREALKKLKPGHEQKDEIDTYTVTKEEQA